MSCPIKPLDFLFLFFFNFLFFQLTVVSADKLAYQAAELVDPERDGLCK
jgi:hypothetical protein